LRLKELVNSGVIIKDNGYRLNGSLPDAPFKYKVRRRYKLKSKISRFIKEDPNGNRDALIIAAFFVLLIVGPILVASRFTVYAHRVYNFDIQSPPGTEFTISVDIHDAIDLYAWQAEIRFDPDDLFFMDVMVGDFLSSNALVIDAISGSYTSLPVSPESTLVFAMDEPGVLMLCGSLLGNMPGKSGTGRLATITFGITSGSQGNANVDLSGDIILLDADALDAEGVLEVGI
jgi:hypothetical protein